MSWLNNGITVCLSAAMGAIGLFYGFAYGGAALLVGVGKIQDWSLRRLERKRWVTTYENECRSCRRREVIRTGMYDADLGWRHVCTFDLCWSCRYHENQPLEIDLDTMSVTQIRGLVPDESAREVA